MSPRIGPPQHSPEWFAVHKTHVTASRIAAILGESEYQTALDVFLEMTGRREPFGGNEFTRRGTRYEPAIVGDYCEQEGKQVEYPVPLYFHPTIEGMAASPDAIILPERRGLLECKWTMSRDIAAQLGEEETDHVPTPWLLQAQCQMAVMGAEFVDFAALVYGRLKVYLVQRHSKLIATIEDAAVDFLRRVREDDPPDADYHDAGAVSALRDLYGLDESECLTLDEHGSGLWAQRQLWAERERDAEKAKKALDAELLDLMHGAGMAWTRDGGKIRRGKVTVEEHTVKQFTYERFWYSKPKGRK
jgi:putative phage-type endonuclease